MGHVIEIVAVFGGYLLGCFSTGYYLVRFRTGGDVRALGSGSSGATNVKRVLGFRGFAIAFIGDAIKGAVAVGGAVYFKLDPLAVILVLIAVIAGHIWPVQLHFRGGKGVATTFGALLAFDYKLALALLVLAGIILALGRRFTLSGLVAVILSPVVAIVMGHPPLDVIGVSVMAVIILIAHRENIRTIFKGIRQSKKKKFTPPDSN